MSSRVWVQSLIMTGRERLGFKPKYHSEAQSFKRGTMLMTTMMVTMNEGTRQKQDHRESEGL